MPFSLQSWLKTPGSTSVSISLLSSVFPSFPSLQYHPLLQNPLLKNKALVPSQPLNTIIFLSFWNDNDKKRVSLCLILAHVGYEQTGDFRPVLLCLVTKKLLINYWSQQMSTVVTSCGGENDSLTQHATGTTANRKPRCVINFTWIS